MKGLETVKECVLHMQMLTSPEQSIAWAHVIANDDRVALIFF